VNRRGKIGRIKTKGKENKDRGEEGKGNGNGERHGERIKGRKGKGEQKEKVIMTNGKEILQGTEGKGERETVRGKEKGEGKGRKR
jgi:hypothetical protein